MRTRFLALVTILAPVIAKRTLRLSLSLSPYLSFFLVFSFTSHWLGTRYRSDFYIRWKSSARMCECVHGRRTEIGCASRYLRIIYHMCVRMQKKTRARFQIYTTNECNIDAEIKYTRMSIHMCNGNKQTCNAHVGSLRWDGSNPKNEEEWYAPTRKKLAMEPLLFIEE